MPVSPSLTPVQLSDLVSSKERVRFVLLLLASLTAWATLGFMLLGALAAVATLGPESEQARSLASVFVYLPMIVGFFFFSHAFFVGHVRGNGVRVSPRQFPAIHELVRRHARTLELAPEPAVYVVQAGGLLNAFAARFWWREFVVLYSDVVALAEERGEGALGFVVAHELGHIRRGHLRWRWFLLPGRLVPFLGSAYYRACEYTCDRIAAHCERDDAVAGLLVLASGKSLYRKMDARLFAEQMNTERGFWVRFAELGSTHPILPKRVAALVAAGVPLPVSRADWLPGAA